MTIAGRAGPGGALSCDGAAGEASMQDRLIIEIRAAEGGDDAKLLVYEQLSIYQKLAAREHL